MLECNYREQLRQHNFEKKIPMKIINTDPSNIKQPLS